VKASAIMGIYFIERGRLWIHGSFCQFKVRLQALILNRTARLDKKEYQKHKINNREKKIRQG